MGGPEATVIGVTDTTIKVAYYWDASLHNSQGGQQLGYGDESKAFQAWIRYINAHANGGGSIMGFPFNLHGRKLVGYTVDSATYSDAEKNRAAAEQIVKQIKPFATISSQTGAANVRMCPIMAAAGILNFGIDDYQFGLSRSTNQNCFPLLQSFDKQVAATQSYLLHRMMHTSYVDPTTGAKSPRKFGFAYAQLPEEEKSAPLVAKQFKAAGIPIVAIAAGGADVQTQVQQASNIIGQFRSAGVNTVIIPDVVFPIAFTNAAQSQGYTPDYYVWPCSSQDLTKVARGFYSPQQWAHARGLTCSDIEVSPDNTVTPKQQGQQWYAAYKSVDSSEPDESAAFIYENLLPLVAGITNAGRDLTQDTFRAGLQRIHPYRYSWSKGVTADPTRELISLDEPNDFSTWVDWTEIQWSVSDTRDNASSPGDYLFLNNGRRYALGQL